MDFVVATFYTSFTWAAAAVLVVSALIAGTLVRLVRDTERNVRASKRSQSSPYTRILLRVLATLLGMMAGPAVSMGLSEIPSVMTDGMKTPYAGPGLYLSMLLGFFGGLMFTMIIAAAKGHLARNPSTAPFAALLPTIEDTDALDRGEINRMLMADEAGRRGLPAPSSVESGESADTSATDGVGPDDGDDV